MSEWIETSSGTRISRLATIVGASSITISANCTIHAGCKLNGEEHTETQKNPIIILGKNSFLEKDCVVDPPSSNLPEESRVPFVMGNYSTIGERTVVRLSLVGNRVSIGSDCFLGELSVINDCCIIENDVKIPPKTVIPPYTRVSGSYNKSLVMEELSAAYRRVLELDSRLLFSLK